MGFTCSVSPINNSIEVHHLYIRLRVSFVIASLSLPLLIFAGAGLSADKAIISYFVFVKSDRGQEGKVGAQR